MQKIDELLKRDLYSGAIGALHEVLEAYFLARSNPGMSAVRFVNNMESDGKADLKTRKSFRQFMSGHKKANRVDPRHKDDCSSYIQYVEDQPGLCEIGICINNNYYFFHFIKVKQ